jgi:hypothetical protein
MPASVANQMVTAATATVHITTAMMLTINGCPFMNRSQYGITGSGSQPRGAESFWSPSAPSEPHRSEVHTHLNAKKMVVGQRETGVRRWSWEGSAAVALGSVEVHGREA